MNRFFLIRIAFFALLLFGVYLFVQSDEPDSAEPAVVVREDAAPPPTETEKINTPPVQPETSFEPEPIDAQFIDSFDGDFTLPEASRSSKSDSTAWWLNSGGYFVYNNGIGQTIQGRLPTGSSWQEKYDLAKGERTDDGHRPQNIFRLLTTDRVGENTQTLSFRVTNTDSTDSVERAGSNGVLLFGHYVDQDNLYYAGLRVDGDLVVKKKKDGVYYTLSQEQIFPGEYNKDTDANLIPKNVWLSLKSVYQTVNKNTVMVTLSIDTNNDGTYDERIVAVDDGVSFGGSALTQEGRTGIRTDFMDVEFDLYTVKY